MRKEKFKSVLEVNGPFTFFTAYCGYAIKSGKDLVSFINLKRSNPCLEERNDGWGGDRAPLPINLSANWLQKSNLRV